MSFLHKKVVLIQGDFSKLPDNVLIIQSVNMNNMKNTVERKILLMTESQRFALMEIYLLWW